jgi:hypothetical protein
MRSLMLFLRDFDWNLFISEDKILAKFIYDTCRSMYVNLEKRGLRIIANKRMDKPVKITFSDLELLSISLMAKYPHDNAHINMVVSKLLLELSIEIINVLNPPKNETVND